MIPLQLKSLKFCRIKKGSKAPFEKDWTNKSYSYEEILKFKNENYGVLCGYGNLAVIDCDNDSLSLMVSKMLPETFSVRTGGGGTHFYYFIPELKKKEILSLDGVHLGEVQSYGTQVVGAGSIHPNGNEYEIINNVGIKKLSLAELKEVIGGYMKEGSSLEEPKNIEDHKVGKETGKLTKEISSEVNFEELLIGYGLEKKGENWNCPFHKSEGGQCLSVDEEKGIFNCFHCGWKGNIISFVSKVEDLTIKQSIDKLKPKKEEAGNQQTTIYRQLASDFYEKQPYFYDSAKIWWMWNKEKYCWEKRDEIDIMNEFDKYFIQESEKSNMKSPLIEALRKCGRKNKPKEIKSSWIQFKNIIYDVENEDTFEATPEYFVANPIPWEVGESEETPKIDELFKTWVNEKDVIKLYELIAYTCVPEMFIHSFIFLFSPPGMGKGTFVNLLLNFIGRYNAVSTSINRINSNPRFETKNWNKKLLITMSEVSNVNELKNSGLINQATGEDPIPAEEKGGGSYDFVNYGKFIYPTNKLLKIDPEDGFGRRARTIKFQTRFEREKNVLGNIPNEEYENLAKKCLRLAKELYERRRFTGDVNISQRMNDYQEESKTILERFIDTNCDTTNFEEKILLDEFFSKYSTYLKTNGGIQKNKSDLAKELKHLGWETKRISVLTAQHNLDGSVKRELLNYVLGMKLSGLSGLSPKSHLEKIHIEKWEVGDNVDKGDNSEGNPEVIKIK